MAWDTATLKTRFNRPENGEVIRYLETHHPSAHSDVASELLDAAKGLPHLHWYCPDKWSYAYVFLHTPSGIIYGLAVGMRTLLFRLPQEGIPTALSEGGELCKELGPEWVSFCPFHPDIPRARMQAQMRRWCEAAYHHASSL
jgi:hypothetical protein